MTNSKGASRIGTMRSGVLAAMAAIFVAGAAVIASPALAQKANESVGAKKDWSIFKQGSAALLR
mgnify:CR=1 FL=1